MRITLDTNVLVGGHDGASGAARQILVRILRGGHQLVLSQSILHELEEVLHYPRVKDLFTLTDGQIRLYVELLATTAELVDIGQPVLLPLTDGDDWPVLRTAIEGAADIICSNDGGFHKPPVIDFCFQYGLRIQKPGELLRSLKQQ